MPWGKEKSVPKTKQGVDARKGEKNKKGCALVPKERLKNQNHQDIGGKGDRVSREKSKEEGFPGRWLENVAQSVQLSGRLSE